MICARTAPRALILGLALAGAGCQGATSSSTQAAPRIERAVAPAEAPAAADRSADRSTAAAAATDDEDEDEVASAGEDDPPTPTPAEAAPEGAPPVLGVFVSGRTTVVYAEPRWGSALRGRVDPDHPFAALEAAEGEGCEAPGWARVELGGYACLRHAQPSEAPPEPLPRVAEGEILPFVYAKPKADRKGVLLAEVPRYRSLRDLRAKRAPIDHLVANRQYAFAEFTKRWGGVYVDADGQAVPASDMVLQKPSELFGRILAEAPIPAGLSAAWSVSLPAVLRDQASPRGREVGSIAYHTAFDVDPAPTVAGGVTWLRVPGAGKDGADAFVDASQIRRWDPGPEATEVPADEPWIDVDIDQQTLALRQGDAVLFVTLVSTGTGKHPTPRGIFRIRNKQALGKMENRPDEPDSYYVEGVPWVQYFYKRFAFHTTYWHRSLGRRRSHGCINLAPRAAAYLFSQTSPALPDGWTSAWEYEEAVGTVVRIRKGDDPLIDRRRPLGDPEDEDDGDDELPEADAGEDEGDEAGP